LVDSKSIARGSTSDPTEVAVRGRTVSIQAVSWVITHSKAKLAARLVLISIANHADKHGANAFPSIATIAAEAAISVRQVQRIIPRLEAMGELLILQRRGGRGRTNGFTIKGDIFCHPLCEEERVTFETERVTSSAERVTSTPIKGDIVVSPEPLEEPLEPSTPPKPPRKRVGMLEGFDDWWKGYPQKVGKGAAEKAWPKARKLVSIDELSAAVGRYIESKPPDREWCHPATWLNQKRWLDEPISTTGALPNGKVAGPDGPPPSVEELLVLIDRRKMGMAR
jgi:hypothetical protein